MGTRHTDHTNHNTTSSPTDTLQSAPEDPTARLSWDEISHALGSPTAADRATYEVHEPIPALRTLGSHISSEHVLTDFKRWLGQIVLHLQRGGALPLGVSKQLAQVACGEGMALRQMAEQSATNARTGETQVASDVANAHELYTAGQKTRDSVFAAIKGLAAHDKSRTLLARLDTAHGNATNHASLGDSLKSMIALIRALRTSGDAQIVQQMDHGGLDEALATRIDQQADKIKAAGEALKGGLKNEPVTVATLNVHDGICLTHMERLMDAFDAGHAIDATVPLLVPISARSVLGTRHARHATAPTGTNDTAHTAPGGANA